MITTHESHDRGSHDDQEVKVKPRHPIASPNPYRRVSAKGLSLAVKPTVIGEAPIIDNENPTFYVIRDYSRSNSLLVGMMTDELDLPSALAEIHSRGLDESSAMVFLHGRNKERESVSPRLERLVKACFDNPELDVNLVPVTILWGALLTKKSRCFAC